MSEHPHKPQRQIPRQSRRSRRSIDHDDRSITTVDRSRPSIDHDRRSIPTVDRRSTDPRRPGRDEDARARETYRGGVDGETHGGAHRRASLEALRRASAELHLESHNARRIGSVHAHVTHACTHLSTHLSTHSRERFSKRTTMGRARAPLPTPSSPPRRATRDGPTAT